MAYHFKYLGFVAVILLALPSPAASEDLISRYCLLPVESDSLSKTDIARMTRSVNVARVAGLDRLVFLPLSGKDRWTIDGERRLVPYDAPFPTSYLDQDNWVVEPWSGRTVAVPSYGPLSVLGPRDESFKALLPDTPKRIHFVGPYLLPRRQMTIVTSKGAPFIVGETALRPWLSRDELRQQGVERIERLIDIPSLKATIVHVNDKRIRLLADDGTWHAVGGLAKWDVGRVYALPSIDGAVYFASRSIFVIRRGDDGSSDFEVEAVAEDTEDLTSRNFWVSQLHGQLLTYDRGGFFTTTSGWQMFGPRGFERIAGGDISPTTKKQDMYARDLPSLQRTLLTGAGGLYLYDGEKIVPAPGGGWERLGKYAYALDLPTIGRVMVSTGNGLFELTQDGELLDHPLPFVEEGYPMPRFFDWPEAGVVIVAARNGIFTLDRDGAATLVAAPDAFSVSWGLLAWIDPGRGELVIRNADGLFIVTDRTGADNSRCLH